MEENVTIQLNLIDGSISIQAPTESLDAIFNRLETFLPKIVDAKNVYAKDDSRKVVIEEEAESIIDSTSHPEKNSNEKITSEKSSTKPSVKTRNGNGKKPENNRMVNFELTPEQRNQFREFYKSKSPNGQNEHVLVVMYWLIKHTKKTSLTRDEIYTGLKTVNERIPTRIASVISNLKSDGKLVSDNDGFRLHHTGEDFVEKDIPKKAAGKE